MSLFAEGTLEKLRIIPCQMADFSDLDPQNEKAYSVLINPETVNEKYEVKYNETSSPGSTSAELKFDKVLPQTYDLDLVFDGTGLLTDDNSLGTNMLGNIASDLTGLDLVEEPESVPDQIKKFKEVVLEYDDNVHQPRYVVLIWGQTDKDALFKGRLTNLDITYTLFHPDGTPLRAKAKATFKQSITVADQNSEKSNNSPDLTHVRIVKEGDTLPLMTHRIYGDSKYYLEVARVNNLKNFRSLEVGSKIIFPPIDKTVA